VNWIKPMLSIYTNTLSDREEHSVRALDDLTQSSRMICTDRLTSTITAACLRLSIRRTPTPSVIGAHAVIPLPGYGSQQELEKDVAPECTALSRYFRYKRPVRC
jgi:hypothetical protein